MASAYFKLKMIKTKRIAAISAKREKGKYIQSQKQSKVYQKSSSSVTPIKKCRICLQEGYISIYDKAHIDYSEFIQQFGGIEISNNDEFPKYLCNTCYNLLQSAILFRTKAKDSDAILRQNLNSEHDADLESHKDAFIVGCNSNDYDIGLQKQYECQPCNITFTDWAEYVVHKNSKQHKNIRIQCPICYGLLTPQLYKRHLARHQSASHLICEVCGKLYRKDNLVRHLQLHSYNLPYKCHLCPYKGRFMMSLNIHKRTHTGDKPFSCEKCQLRFLTRSNLNRHLLTHNKDRPFKCIECGRGFYVKRDLDVHYKTDHVGIKDYGCTLCGNKYGTRKSLMRHELRVHKRDKLAKGRMPLYMQLEYR